MANPINSDSLIRDHLGILDFGPIYAETANVPGEVIVEPFNAWSSLLIALPAVYWAWRLWGRYRQYWFLTLCMPFLFLNGLGSTLFHATRSSNALLVMDFAPAAIVTLAVTIYLWAKVLRKWHITTLVIIALGAARFGVASSFEPPLSINLSYAVGGLGFLIPLIILLVQMKGKGTFTIIATFLAFGAALLCREADPWPVVTEVLPMGTHFLWHAFTGVGGFLLGSFLYTLETESIARRKEKKAPKAAKAPSGIQMATPQ